MTKGKIILIAVLSAIATAGSAVGIYYGVKAAQDKKADVPEVVECVEHTYGDWTTTQDPDCTTAGKKERACTVCGAKQEDTVPALGHDLVHHAAQAPTCTAVGWEAYDTCSRCDYSTYAETPALGHDLVHHAGQAPTCTEAGWKAYDTCSRCDYSTYEAIPAGHDLVHHAAQAPTCTEAGWEAYDTCSRCDYTTYTAIPALGHDLVHHDAKAPTCTAVGWEAYDTCSRCDYSTYEEIPALGHDLVHHDAQAATCTEAGWEAYDTCSRCDYSTYEALSALGHDLVHHDGQAATCTEAGWEDYDTCSRCDYTTYTEIPAAHHYVDGICTVCGAEAPIPLYTRISVEGEADETGDYVYFGTYPQSEVTDATTVDALNALAGDLPEDGDATKGDWVSYGYYIESSVTNFMWYIDLSYSGEKYRGVYFTQYRPTGILGSGSESDSIQDNRGYYTSTVYWFKYEPVKWRILSEEDGEALVLCEMIVDVQHFYHQCDQDIERYRTAVADYNDDYYAGNGSTVSASVEDSDYTYSDIRRWLNETFYLSAFTDLQREIIDDSNSQLYQVHQDKVFLLHSSDVAKSVFCFQGSSVKDPARVKEATDYAVCQGAWTDIDDRSCDWVLRNAWTRYPPYISICVYLVNSYGEADYGQGVTCCFGVAPALVIRL